MRLLAGLLVIQIFQVASLLVEVAASNLPINKHLFGALFVLLKWALLVVPIALMLWLPVARREFSRQLAVRWLSHSTITSICLAAIPALLLLLFTGPFPLAGSWVGTRTNEAYTRWLTANHWATYGFYFAQALVVPAALVYLARRQLKAEAT